MSNHRSKLWGSREINRRAVTVFAIVAMAVLAGCAPAGPAYEVSAPQYWPTEGWQVMAPEAAGFRSDKLAEGLLAIRQEDIPIHSFMIIRHGYVLVEAYFYPYDGNTAHDMASVTKSVMTTLIGMAIDQGKLDLDDPMISFFPGRTIANLDASKQRITVEHLVRMSSGLECTEENEATQRAMEASSDWVQFTLDLPVAWEPGSHFVYCNPAIHLLSPILEQATGMTALEFAERYLFEPLGIAGAEWRTDPHGHNRGWGDLSLRPVDAAKLGLLWLQQGRWEDAQIVSAEWVQAASERHMREAGGRPEDYGYGWWVSDPAKEEIGFVQAAGVGGQLIKLFPALDLALVTTGGGFEVTQIDPYIVASIGDLERPVASNPAGEDALRIALQQLSLPPIAQPIEALPGIVETISGRTFRFPENELGLEWFRLAFDGLEEADAELGVEGEATPRRVRVGLDGVYRSAPEGARPALGRGRWEDGTTFVFEYDTLPGYEHYTFRLRFEQDRVEVRLWERVWGIQATLEGQATAP